MIVTATPLPPTMQLLIGAPPAGVTGWRITGTTPEGTYSVRGTPNPSSGILIDYQVPLSDPARGISRPVTYQVTAITGSGSTTASTTGAAVVYPGARLTDSERPGYGMDVTVESQTPMEWQPRSVFYDVIDRGDPVVAMQTARMRSGTLVLLTATQAERAQLRDLIRNGSPLLLRTTNPARAEDTMMLPTRVESADRLELGALRRWTLEYQSLALDQGAYAAPPTRTYATARADTRFPTYLSLYSVDTNPDVYFIDYADYKTGKVSTFP